MKILYGVPYIHNVTDDGEHTHDFDIARREIIEASILARIEALQPATVFLEEYGRGENVTSKFVTLGPVAPQDSVVFRKFVVFGRLAAQGCQIRGMDSKGIGRFHGAIIDKHSLFSERNRSRLLIATKHLGSARGLLSVALHVLQILLFVAVGRLRNCIYVPLNAVCMHYRDYYMARSICSSATDGVNVAMYGAAHKPLRWISRHRFLKHLLITETEIQVMTDDLQFGAQARKNALEVIDQMEKSDEDKAKWRARLGRPNTLGRKP